VSDRSSPWTLEQWEAHWNSKADVEDPLELNGYCVGGVPISAELYRAAVIEPYLDRLELAAHHHVLEVGCGWRLQLREIEGRVERTVGTDFSEALLRRYRGSAETYLCGAHELPFEGEQFDRILMCSVVHCFPGLDYLRRVMLKLVSLLRAPGILLIGDVLLGRQPPDTPFRWFDRREILDILEPLDLPFSIAAQSRLKRAINRRYDIVVYKD